MPDQNLPQPTPTPKLPPSGQGALPPANSNVTQPPQAPNQTQGGAPAGQPGQMPRPNKPTDQNKPYSGSADRNQGKAGGSGAQGGQLPKNQQGQNPDKNTRFSDKNQQNKQSGGQNSRLPQSNQGQPGGQKNQGGMKPPPTTLQNQGNKSAEPNSQSNQGFSKPTGSQPNKDESSAQGNLQTSSPKGDLPRPVPPIKQSGQIMPTQSGQNAPKPGSAPQPAATPVAIAAAPAPSPVPSAAANLPQKPATPPAQPGTQMPSTPKPVQPAAVPGMGSIPPAVTPTGPTSPLSPPPPSGGASPKPPVPSPGSFAPAAPKPMGGAPAPQPTPLGAPPLPAAAKAPQPVSPPPGGGSAPSPVAPQPVGANAPVQPPAGGKQQPPASSDGKKQPVFAKVTKSPLKFLPIIGGALILLLVIGFAITRLFSGGSSSVSVGDGNNNAATPPREQTTLTYWGLWEPESVMEPVIKEFEKANPGVLVNYQQQSPQDYRERLQTAIASGQGPDVFRYHASWVPMLRRELAPMPSSVMPVSEFQQSYYPVAYQQLQVNGQIVGMPLMYDGLVLYYNQDILETAGAQPPKNWAELKQLASKLTVRSASGIERAGFAAGTANNVDHFPEIIGLLAFQNGGDLSNPTAKPVVEALTFYTNFTTQDQVWDGTLPNSTVAFARGEVAMMIAPSWRYHEIKAQNPDLKFTVTAVPSLADQEATWATYWVEGVSAQSKNKELSWKLLDFLGSKEQLQSLYSNQAQSRSFGEPYPRTDMMSTTSQPVLESLLEQAPQAKSWYLNSWTFDNGLNDQLIKYYQDAVNAVLAGESPDKVMVTVGQGTTQVLRQYGVSTGTSTGTSTP